MSCGTCSEKNKSSASAAIGSTLQAKSATGAVAGNTRHCPVFGQYVKVLDWVGRIEGVATSESRTLILVRSPKGIWLNHSTEWLEYNEALVTPASADDIDKEIKLRRKLMQRMIDALDAFEKQSTIKALLDVECSHDQRLQ